MPKRNFTYTTEFTPPSNSVSTSIFVALRIARLYRHRMPAFEELMTDFGMSRATAYWWIRAMREERGLNTEAA